MIYPAYIPTTLIIRERKSRNLYVICSWKRIAPFPAPPPPQKKKILSISLAGYTLFLNNTWKTRLITTNGPIQLATSFPPCTRALVIADITKQNIKSIRYYIKKKSACAAYYFVGVFWRVFTSHFCIGGLTPPNPSPRISNRTCVEINVIVNIYFARVWRFW